MSIVNNYKLEKDEISYIGDYKEHKGMPSITRSDSMLKAIGKSINIRMSNIKSNKIPIIILGNSPITKSYSSKVDYLKKAGIIQSFISLYPNPTDSFLKNTENKGFQTFDKKEELETYIQKLVKSDMNFFSSMLPKKQLGEIIEISSREENDTLKAEKFLQLINL